ncbi:MAG: CotH kinase family protein [Polyangiaceae bacterium]
MKLISSGFLRRLLFASLAVGFPSTWGCETEPTTDGTALELESDLVVTPAPAAGTFVGTQRIRLTASESAEIHYTLDGTVPTLDSPIYREPIEITESVRLYAIAYEFESAQAARVPVSAVSESIVSTEGHVGDRGRANRNAFGCSWSPPGGGGGSSAAGGGSTSAGAGGRSETSEGGATTETGGSSAVATGGATESGGSFAVATGGATETGGSSRGSNRRSDGDRRELCGSNRRSDGDRRELSDGSWWNDCYRWQFWNHGGWRRRSTGHRDDRPSDPAAECRHRRSYLRLAEDAATFTSHLPILIIQTENAQPIDRWSNVFVPSTLLVFEPMNGRASILGTATMDTRMGIHVRGELAREQEKLKYTVEFWDNHEDVDVDRPFLGMPADSDWVLLDPIDADTSLIKNALASVLSNSIHRYAPRTEFAEVYLSTDGGPIVQEDFVGFYTVMERIKRGKARVDVKKLPTGVTGSDLTGGYILRDDKGPADFMAADNKWQFVYPDAEDMILPERAPHLAYIKSYIDEFGVALASSEFRNPTTQKHYGDYIDVDSFIDHNIINAYMKNVDGLRFSTYFHKNRDGLLVAGPIWDFDCCAGALEEWRSTQPEEWFLAGTDGTDYFTYGLWGRLFRDPAFKARYIERFSQLIANEFSEASVHAKIDALATRVGDAAERNYVRWPNHRPFAKTHASEIERVKTFFSRRIAFIDRELRSGLP